jgi:hypothetical protein
MRIMNFRRFNEAANGVDLWNGSMPLTPRLKVHNTITTQHTNVVLGMDENFYTEDDFKNLHNDYLKKGGTEQISDFNKKNLDIILNFFNISM